MRISETGVLFLFLLYHLLFWFHPFDFLFMPSGRVNNFAPKSLHKSVPSLHGDNLGHTLIPNHCRKRNLLIGLTLGFELITSKGEEITFIDLENSGIILKQGQ